MRRTSVTTLFRILHAYCLCILAVGTALQATGGGSYLGQVSGVPESDGFDDVTVVLSGSAVLETTSLDFAGRFGFYDLADGDYVVQVRKPGYRSPPARPFRVEFGGRVSSTSTENEFVLQRLDDKTFVFHWEEDQSTAGYDYSSHRIQQLEAEFIAEETPLLDGSSANRLLHDYNILLVNQGDRVWTHEHAYRLLQTMQAIPQRRRDPYRKQSLPPSHWIITSDHVENDIVIESGRRDRPAKVQIADHAFVHARPKIALIEGKRGAYYSQRLHHALVRFVTDNGRDVDAYEKILQERYGVTTRINEHTSFEVLTENTTYEPAWRFQRFHSEEIVQIINTFEEMPSGMHSIPGLRYLVRRLDGTPHPLYPGAPAVAWTGAGYIEFMDTGFLQSSVLRVHRLIIHEKAHFLWKHVLDEQLRQDWIHLGGWYVNPNDADGWSTTKQTEFVSAYAHGKNPNEDMAESVAYFIINPDKLRSRSIAKYEFVRDRIMQGNIYISKIRDDLTFEVYNLYPDYVFPGKIRRVDIEVKGGPEEDKAVRVQIELHALDGVLEGATKAYLRIFSEVGTYIDLHLYPLGLAGGSPGTVLAGSFSLSKFAKAGNWQPDQIRLTDEHGNERLEGTNDFGWSLFVNNSLDDVIAPRYVRNSASLTKSTVTLESREVQIISATWAVEENSGEMKKRGACYATLNDEIATTYRFHGHGDYDYKQRICRVRFEMPHYMPSSVYTMNYVRMTDLALNTSGVYFGDPGQLLRQEQSVIDEPAQQIELITENEDIEPPEVDLNNISIQAEPTRPEDPNGETLVTLSFRVRDNISGFVTASFYLRDPQGVDRHFYASDRFRSRLFPRGDPSKWAVQTPTLILPIGSPPGTWGLAEMTVRDRAKNFRTYDFTEIIRFDVE